MTAGSQPRGAVVEIYERTGRDVTNVGPGSLLTPTEVRINGVPLYCPDDCPPVVERIAAGMGDLVRVTLTVLARRVVIDAAPDVLTTDQVRAPGGMTVVDLPEGGPYSG